MEDGVELLSDRIEPSKGRRPNACLRCRRIKMQCRPVPASEKCERCTKAGSECIFQEHRRGRKLGMRLADYRASGGSSVTDTQGSPIQTSNSQQDGALGDAQIHSAPIATTHGDSPEGSHQLDLGRQRGSFKGQFSLRTVLSTIAEPGEVARSPQDDASQCPIKKGLLNHVIAAQLFDGFMQNMNPLISQFDPKLHTLHYILRGSSFLLTSILAAAAKAFNPSVHRLLQDHAESLFLEAFRRGKKSTEIVQAILLLTYWKDPEDTRVFVNVGLAIRIAIELGWHKLTLVSANTASGDDDAARQLRNVQRTWLVLFVYDRSISMQTGKPWMIERSDFIDSVEEWHKSSIAIPNDALLCAFVKLRLLTSDISRVIRSAEESTQESNQALRPLLRIMQASVRVWDSQCSTLPDAESCHRFLIKFYGQHILFVVFSYPLHQSLSHASKSLDLEAFWTSLNAALGMLRLATEQSATPILYFVQDSIHIMTAHAAAFLIKVLYTVPKHIKVEIADNVVDCVQSAAQAFAAQSAPKNTACALQASFLSNVVSLLKGSADSKSVYPGTTTSEPTTRDSGHDAGDVQSATGQQTTRPHAIAQDTGFQPLHHSDIGPAVYAAGEVDRTPLCQDSNFFDEEFWTSTFASAGFDVNDGLFLPNDDP